MLTVFITDTERGFQISQRRCDGGRDLVGDPRRLPQHPDFASLRFYLEDYLHHPVGAFADRAQHVAGTDMPAWGRWFVDAIFGDEGLLSALQEIIIEQLRRGLSASVVIESTRHSVQALPWELMVPWVVPELPSNRLSVIRSFGAFDPTTTEQFGSRMLMVIARPSGARDIDHQIIAQQVTRWNSARAGPLHIDVLRPPSFGQFERALADASAAGQPYDIVHFDGHGDFSNDAGSEDGGGYLMFEGGDAAPDAVPADVFAAALRAGHVKFVLLNACRSAAIDGLDGTAPGVATAILASAGVAAVVAMTHNIQVRAAELFVSAFYNGILSGAPVTSCFVAGRNALVADFGRPSPIGLIPLQDWMVPVLYAARDLAFAEAKRSEGETVAGETSAPALYGRDDAFLHLERMLHEGMVVLLHGTIGIGKTALATRFAEWIRQTGGLGKEKSGASGWLRLSGWPPDRSVAMPDAPLVIVDDIEHISVLSTAEEAKAFVTPFIEFLRDVAQRNGRVILITRSAVPWLKLSGLRVQRLDDAEAGALCTALVPGDGGSELREGRLALVRRLAGHPGAIESIWPQLKTRTVSDLADALDGAPSPARDSIVPDTRTVAALRRTLDFLDDDLRPYFMAVVFLLGVADALTLKICLAGCGLVGSIQDAHKPALTLLKAAWAAGAGAPATEFPPPNATDLDLLLRPMRLHPQLPLAFADQPGPKGESPIEWQAKVCRVIAEAQAGLARIVMRDIEQNPHRATVFQALELQRDCLVRSLGLLFNDRAFDDAAALLGLIARVESETTGDKRLVGDWTGRILRQLGDDPGGMTYDAFFAWLPIYANQAIRILQAKEVDAAEQMFETVRTLLESGYVEAPAVLALCYRMLGQVHGSRPSIRDADVALDWFEKAIALSRPRDNAHELACGLHDRATVLNGLNRFKEAERDALEAARLRDEIKDRRQLAHTYRLLSSIYRGSGRLSEAQQYSDLAGIAAMGAQDLVAEGQSLLDLVNASLLMGPDAKQQLTRAIQCFLAAKADRQLVLAYLQMAQIEQMASDFDEAERWLHHAGETATLAGDKGLLAQVSQAKLLLERIGRSDRAGKAPPDAVKR
ncbi:CHAT domain-containing protein [Bradyrhizobium sp. 21]|uniref:CHAT domain-containing tetratricopeptide repeat protein n=1 Tax=Bradyrhizobium sp. 21 TaxID=2782666 RepID=UPI001FF8C9F6|nr:CHAT domain-containing protein [Bradyrhizobium sp. 21]MCK1383596.1 CHAT domain-containing protein [Bradyrhizobium sp. 21]